MTTDGASGQLRRMMATFDLTQHEAATLLGVTEPTITNYQPTANPQLDERIARATQLSSDNPFTNYGHLTVAKFAGEATRYPDEADLLRLCTQLSNDTKWITTAQDWGFFLAEPDTTTPWRLLVLAAALADYLNTAHSPAAGHEPSAWFHNPELKLSPPWCVGIPEHLTAYRHQVANETPPQIARHGVSISAHTFVTV